MAVWLFVDFWINENSRLRSELSAEIEKNRCQWNYENSRPRSKLSALIEKNRCQWNYENSRLRSELSAVIERKYGCEYVIRVRIITTILIGKIKMRCVDNKQLMIKARA